MIDRSKDTADFDARITAMGERLSQHGVAIVQKDYSAEAFGSWHVVAGDEKKNMDFSYDRKDSCLTFRDAAVTPRDHHDLQHRRFDTWSGEDPIAFVEEFLAHEFPKPWRSWANRVAGGDCSRVRSPWRSASKRRRNTPKHSGNVQPASGRA